MKKKFLILSLALAALQALPSMAQQSTVIQALQEMRNYCMAEICLGMSIEDVSVIDGGKLELWSTAKGKRNCAGSYGEWDQGYFTSNDGVKFIVGFRDYPGSESIKKRFRVQSVSIDLEVTKDELEALRGRITSRYEMFPSSNPLIEQHKEWIVINPLFSVVVSDFFKHPPKKSILVISARSDKYPEWLRSQPECSNERQPLPVL